MNIKFKKKRLFINLLLGIVWLGLGFSNIISDEDVRWSNYLYFLAGVLYTIHFLYDYFKQYLTIEDGTIIKNKLYGWKNKINLDEITSIKAFAGDYTLISATNEFKINSALIDPESLIDLTTILSKIDLPADKTPFNKEEAAA